MKKFLALILALIMCLGVFAACGDTEETTGATLEDAKNYLFNMMKDKNGKALPNDYDVVGKVTVDGTSFDVTWTTDNANIKVKESSKADFWTIDLPDVNDKEVEYKLTATIKDAAGKTIEVTFTPKLPVLDNAGVATEFEAGVAYKMFMKQANLGYTVYALNTTQNGENKYIETTLDPKAAAVFYVEVVDGGYKIYTEIDGVKNYLHAELKAADGGKMSKYIGFKADSTCVFTYDKELAVFKITLSGTEYGVGTYNAFETISLSEASYFKADNINVAGGQFPIGLMTKEHADTLAPSEKPVNNDPAANSTLSIADAIALGKTKAKGVYTEGKYYVEGTVKEIQNEQYGNLVITDGTNDLLIYGTYSEDGKTGFDKLETKPAVGDKIKVYGVIGMYNDAQMKNGWIIGAAAGENGGGSATPSVSTELVEAPVAGTAYKFGMVQTAAGKTVYLKGGMDGYYMATTENAAEAIDVYLEETTGGFYFYTMSGETKTYINAVVNEAGTHINGAYEATASTVYTFDDALKTIVTAIVGTADAAKDGSYAFGTRNDKNYTTAGPVYADATKSFICQFYTVVEGEGGNTEGGDTPVVPTPPACENHIDNNGDYKCDTENCGVLTGVPAADSALTIPQANALGVAHAHNTYTEGTYSVSGEIVEVSKPQYGEMKIKDADNNILFVYNSTAADGTAYNDLDVKYIVGDKVTVVGKIGQYNGNAQMKGGLVTVTEQHAHEFNAGECVCGAADPNFVPTHVCEDGDDEDFICDNADCDKVVAPAADSVLTVKQALALASVLGNTYTTDKYYITGVVTTNPNATHGNLDLTADGETVYIYGLWDATGANKYGNMAEKPVKGDTITVYTVIGNYNGNAQLKDAWTTELVPHGDNHTYVEGVCTVCGASEPVAGQSEIFCDFSTFTAGTQYANETLTVNDTVSVSTFNEGCHLTTQLRIYDSNSNNGYAVINSTKTIAGITVNAGYKAASLEVYGSADGGETWTLIETVTTKSAYADYTVAVDSSLGYTMLKLDAVGNQVRIPNFNLVVVG